jgi:hypothetical protein
MYGKFLGLVTPREVDFEADHMKPLAEVMTKCVRQFVCDKVRATICVCDKVCVIMCV